MSKRVVIDLDKWRRSPGCQASCSYYYHPENDGVVSLVEIASFEIFCRRCDQKSCVAACRYDALEEQDDGTLKRYNMLCVACKSCVQACPFGIIIPTALLYKVTICDFCIGRKDGEPECVRTCSCGALTYEEIEEESNQLHFVGEHIAVKSLAWEKLEPVEEKR